jgi:hypothetical protein
VLPPKHLLPQELHSLASQQQAYHPRPEQTDLPVLELLQWVQRALLLLQGQLPEQGPPVQLRQKVRPLPAHHKNPDPQAFPELVQPPSQMQALLLSVLLPLARHRPLVSLPQVVRLL